MFRCFCFDVERCCTLLTHISGMFLTNVDCFLNDEHVPLFSVTRNVYEDFTKEICFYVMHSNC